MNRRDFVKNALLATAAFAVAPSLLAKEEPTRKVNAAMKILVLTGSPRKNGNTNTLADKFIQGATEVGHSVDRFDSAFKKVHSCIACDVCEMSGKPCVFKDDFEFVRSRILEADMVVFVSPVYFWGFSTPLKAVMDRFHALYKPLHTPKKAILMTACATPKAETAKALSCNYESMIAGLGWTDAGQIIAPGVGPEGAILKTDYPKQAYLLGKNLGGVS